MRCSTTSDEKYEGVLDNVLQQLYTSDSAKLATTCAALAMLISQAPQNIESLSSKVLPEATRLLHSEHPLVQVTDSYAAQPVTPCKYRTALASNVMLPCLQQNACAIVMTLAETQAQELSSGMQAWSEAVSLNVTHGSTAAAAGLCESQLNHCISAERFELAVPGRLDLKPAK